MSIKFNLFNLFKKADKVNAGSNNNNNINKTTVERLEGTIFDGNLHEISKTNSTNLYSNNYTMTNYTFENENLLAGTGILEKFDGISEDPILNYVDNIKVVDYEAKSCPVEGNLVVPAGEKSETYLSDIARLDKKESPFCEC